MNGISIPICRSGSPREGDYTSCTMMHSSASLHHNGAVYFSSDNVLMKLDYGKHHACHSMSTDGCVFNKCRTIKHIS